MGFGLLQRTTLAMMAAALLAIQVFAQPGGDCNDNGVPDDEETRRTLFHAPLMLLEGGQPIGAALADLDGDGDLDAAVARDADRTVTLLRNDGLGGFASTALALSVRAFGLTAVDHEGDGDLDLVGADAGAVRLLINDGHGAFALRDGPSMPNLERAHPADLDGDGDADLVTAAGNANLSVHRNDGDGFGAAVTLGGLQSLRPVALADADADGDLDIFAGDLMFESVFVFRNNGAAAFTLAGVFPAGGAPNTLAAADLDGDNAADVVVKFLQPGQTQVLFNTGDGMLESPITLPGERFAVPLATDIDSDGRRDLVITDGFNARLTVLRNAGNRVFEAPLRYQVGSAGPLIAAGDVDADGHPDLLVGDSDGDVNLVRGAGRGRLFAPLVLPITTELGNRSVSGVAASDLDGDQRPELLAAAGELVRFANLGSGDFGAAEFVPVSHPVGVLASADLDADGDTDVIAGPYDGDRLSVLENRAGALVEKAGVDGLSAVDQLLLADLDTDADLDLVAHGRLSVLRNRGDATFDAPVSYDGARSGRFVTIADFDGDGDADLASGPLTSAGAFVILFNDGEARFQPRQEAFNIANGQTVRALVSPDVEGDGDPDLIFIGEQDRLWLLRNRSDGTFAAAEVVEHAVSFATAAISRDVDADGAIDLLLARGDEVHVGRNRAGSGFAFDRGAHLANASILAMVAAEVDGAPPFDLVLGERGGGARPGRVVVVSGGQSDPASVDCDANGRPDECDLAGGDCDANGRPDACDPDADRDAVPDACDRCPGADDAADSDSDGTPDCMDGCPSDAEKVAPGICGCGTGDQDGDGDGVADCIDNCVAVANGDQANADGDGAGNACDQCPDDPNQVFRGPCDCGVPLRDSDRDGTLDCVDGCASDRFKTDPGVCGCSVLEVDTGDGDGDAVPNCRDNCPRIGNPAQDDGDGDGIGDACDAFPEPACWGDCDGDWRVLPDDLERGIAAIFATVPLASCRPFDTDGDGVARANDLVGVLQRRDDCIRPTMTPSPTPTPTPAGGTAEFRVSSGRSASAPAVCARPSGEFVIAWEQNAIVGQRFAADARPIGGGFVINPPGARPQSVDIACLNDGRFLVVWQGGTPETGADVFGQLFDADGTTAQQPARLSNAVARDQRRPRVATNGTDRFVVAWEGEEGDAPFPPDNVFVRRFDGAAVPLAGEVRVNAILGAAGPAVAMAADGSFAVLFYSGGVSIRPYDRDGIARGGEFPVNLTLPSSNAPLQLEVDGAGEYLAAWQASTFAIEGEPLYARRVTSDGASGDEIALGRVSGFIIERFALARGGDGTFVAAWVPDPGSVIGDEGTEIAAARFGADGQRVAGPFMVNDTILCFDRDPAAAVSDAGFVVVWHRFDTSGDHAIFAKRYDLTSAFGQRIAW